MDDNQSTQKDESLQTETTPFVVSVSEPQTFQPEKKSRKMPLIIIVVAVLFALSVILVVALLNSKISKIAQVDENETKQTQKEGKSIVVDGKFVSYSAAGLETQQIDTSRQVDVSKNGEIILQTVRNRQNIEAGKSTSFDNVYISRDCGNKWSRLDLPLIKPPETNVTGTITDTNVSEDGKTMLIGVVYFSTTGSREEGSYLLASFDSAKSWSKLTIPAGVFPGKVTVVQKNLTLFIADGSVVATKSLYRSNDRGSTWQQLTPATSVSFNFSEAAFSANGTRIAIPTVPTQQKGISVYVSADSGKTWRVGGELDLTMGGIPNTQMHQLQFSSHGKRLSGVVSRLKDKNGGGKYDIMLFSTTNDGRSWSKYQIVESSGRMNFPTGANVFGQFTDDAETFIGAIEGVPYSARLGKGQKIDVGLEHQLNDVRVFANGDAFIGMSTDGYYVGRL